MAGPGSPWRFCPRTRRSGGDLRRLSLPWVNWLARREYSTRSCSDYNITDETHQNLRASLVSNNVFSYLALSYRLHEHGSRPVGIQKHAADLFEAYVGAAVLDGKQRGEEDEIKVFLQGLYKEEVWGTLRRWKARNQAKPKPKEGKASAGKAGPALVTEGEQALASTVKATLEAGTTASVLKIGPALGAKAGKAPKSKVGPELGAAVGSKKKGIKRWNERKKGKGKKKKGEQAVLQAARAATIRGRIDGRRAAIAQQPAHQPARDQVAIADLIDLTRKEDGVIDMTLMDSDED